MLECQEQNSAGGTESVRSESKASDKTITKSASLTSNKPKEIVDKPDRPNRIPSASGKSRKEPLIPKPIRTHTNSTSSLGTSPRIPKETPTKPPVESGKVIVDTYHSLPNNKLKVDTGQRNKKLQEIEGPSLNINANLKDTVSKVNKGMSIAQKRGEPIPNAVVTDLTQVQNQYSEGYRQGQNKYAGNSRLGSNTNSVNKEKSAGTQNNNSAVVERRKSASSSSSHDDYSLTEPRSWSVTNEERSEREVSI